MEFREGIMQKIYSYRQFDKKRFKRHGTVQYEDVLELIKRQEGKCYVCQDPVVISNWKPRCLYQFSLDRIDESKPHDSDNVLLSCYFCNCVHHARADSENKVCINGCHTAVRDIDMLRTYISNNEIKHLLLTARPIEVSNISTEKDLLEKQRKHIYYLKRSGTITEEMGRESLAALTAAKKIEQIKKKEAALTCQTCSKVFNQKSHLDVHMARKTPCVATALD